MKLDKYWVMSNIDCPKCHKRLLYDTHDAKDATHYCKECQEGMIIVFNASLRWLK